MTSVEEELPVVLLPVSVSAQELTCLGVEKEEKEPGEPYSPRAVLEAYTRSVESDTTLSSASTSSVESQLHRSPSSHWRGFFKLFKQRSMKRLCTIPPVPVPKIHRRNKSAREDSRSSKLIPPIDPDHIYFKPSWKNFTLAELKAATSNFSTENLIGRGGHAKVYKGQLEDGRVVAVKRLDRGTTEERTIDFLSEIGIIVHINHQNAAKLVGFGVDGGMHLVLQLSPHGSLACLLSGSKEKLTWTARYKISLGTAEGLHYLHRGCQRRIIHRDIKSANILLTEDFEPQISDFGLAKWLPEQWTHHTVSKFEGTFGYVAPEYLLHGIVDEKTDVFAFGVLLLELMTGRLALGSNQSLVMWAKPLLEKNDIKELVDPSLGDDYNPEEMSYVTLAALKCLQNSSFLRPEMKQVIQTLKGNDCSRSSQLLMHRTFSEETLDAEEYNSTKYLHDLDRHRQLAMEFEI